MLVVLHPTPEEQTVFQVPEENVSQPSPLKEPPVVVAEELLQEHLFLPVHPNEQPEERAGWYYCLPERDLPGVQSPPLIPWPPSEPPPLAEATLPQPELFREPVVPPSSFVPELAFKQVFTFLPVH